MLKKIDHVVLTTTNKEACADFYQKLGFHFVDRGERYEFMAGDFKLNVHFAGQELEPKAARVQPGSADICIEITSLAVFCKQLYEHNIPIEKGPLTRHGVWGEMQSVYVRDPDGNLLEYCEY